MDTANIGTGAKSDSDSFAPPLCLDRRQPAFPPEHAPIVGQINYAVRVLVEAATITPAEAKAAMVGARTEFWQNAERAVAWLSQLMKEKERGTD